MRTVRHTPHPKCWGVPPGAQAPGQLRFSTKRSSGRKGVVFRKAFLLKFRWGKKPFCSHSQLFVFLFIFLLRPVRRGGGDPNPQEGCPNPRGSNRRTDHFSTGSYAPFILPYCTEQQNKTLLSLKMAVHVLLMDRL